MPKGKKMNFEWLNEIISGLLKFVPRPVIIRATHGGVCWLFGKYVRELKPGWHWIWPLIMDWLDIVVARQTNNIETQTVETKDGIPVSISMVVVYSINNIIAAIGEKNWDVDTTVNDISQVALTGIVNTNEYEYLRLHLTGEIQTKLTEYCRRELKKFGVQVSHTGIVNFAKAEVKVIFGLKTNHISATAI